jgi:prolyl-tRNA editing enzyme YbaK/EbsC (Cys-tRNA(Pro) deacylase)
MHYVAIFALLWRHNVELVKGQTMHESLHSPEELRALAAARGFAATLHPADRPMPTVETAAEALGIPVAAMTKNIVFLVGDTPILTIATGQTRIDDRALAQHFGVGRKKVGIASPDQAYAISGFVVGCMPSFGHKTALPTLIDPAVLALERVYGGTGDPAVLIALPPHDLVALTGGVVVALSRQE